MSTIKKSALIVLGILFFDQLSKFLIKLNLMIGEEIPVFGNWFIIHFTENNGMAFGLEFGGDWGKMLLSLFRIAAVIGICIYIFILSRKKASSGLIISLSMILAGALGNILDSLFYGIIFSESHFGIAQLFPEGGGYSGFLHGRVVDWLYFPVIQTDLPGWFPFWANQEFIFFRPIFNIADSAITIGVILILIFQRKFFK